MNDTKCGFVAVVGRPNAGKSSLLNFILGEKIAMVSHKANATRKRANLIAMHGDSQIVFVDTPGLHEKEKLLNQYMLDEALKAIGDCDLICFLAPVTDDISHYQKFLEKNAKQTPHFVILTKIDFVSKADVFEKINEYEKLNSNFLGIIPTSIKQSSSKNILLDAICKYLPQGPFLFDPEILTTSYLREIYKEFIREAIFEKISDEIPYEADVKIDKIEEKPNVDVIKATIIVEKQNQKGMIIGEGGAGIKRIGKYAREKIEKLSGKKAFLELFVSVKKGWSKNKQALKEFGYDFEN
jgi:GTP-binding protein Era